MSKNKSVHCGKRTQKYRKMLEANNNGKIKEKLSSIWGIIGLGLTLIGCGFAAGRYYEHTQNTLEHNDKVLELNKELLNVKENNEIVVHDLRNQIYELQNKLLIQKSHHNEEEN